MILALGALRWIVAVALASALGTLVVVLLIAIGRIKRDHAVPFAPFLAIGSVSSLLLTPVITTYLRVGV